MGDRYRLELGWFRQRRYILAAEAFPSFNDVEEFVVTVYYRSRPEPGRGRNIEVARIDNRAHGYTHFDRLFERGDPKERFDGGVWDAVRHLQSNWRTYARRYKRNHG